MTERTNWDVNHVSLAERSTGGKLLPHAVGKRMTTEQGTPINDVAAISQCIKIFCRD